MRLIGGIVLAGLIATALGVAGEPPRILNLQLSSHAVHTGDTWSGQITTTSNVASVEMRCAWFSLSLPRRTYGQFFFRYSVLDVPVVFRRVYAVTFIARTANGERTERVESVDFR